MRNLDLVKFIEGLHDYIGKAVAPLAEKLSELEGNIRNTLGAIDGTLVSLSKRVEVVETRDPPKDGKDADEEAIVARLKEDFTARFEGVKSDLQNLVPEPPKPLVLEDFRPLVDAAVAQIRSMAAEDISKAVASLPTPKDGVDGVDGKSFTLDEVRAIVREAVEETQARWELSFERRAAETLQRAIDRMPAPKDGVDGLGFDDLRIEHDGERKFALILERGERVKRCDFTIPAVIDRGYYVRGETKAEAGDGYTFGGSYWVAQEATESEPTVENKAWRLAVKRGRDARQVQFAPKKESGPVRLNGGTD